MRFVRFALLFLNSLVIASAIHAQAVHWEPGDPALGNTVQLVFEDCEPDGDPQIPPIPTATLALAGTSTTMNMVNFSVTRTVTLSYLVQARRGGALQIPAFSVKTNKGPIKVAAFNGTAPTINADSVATAKLIPDRTTVWAGEIFDLKYKLVAARRNNPQFDGSFEWNAAPLVTEEWSKPGLSENIVDGQRYIVMSVGTRAYAKNAGPLKLEAAHQIVHVQTGAVGFGLFSQARMEPISITSDQPTLEVKPLPPPPAGFDGAVGEFKLTSKIVPKEAAVGEPITWTLELSGTGNWPEISGLPARDVSRDFQVVQPRAKRTPADGKLFDVTLSEDVVLVPTKPGTYALGPIAFTFFNPHTGAYETARVERTMVKVTAPANAASAVTSAPSAGSGGTPAATDVAPPSHPAPSAPAAPAAIPRDPLPGHGDAAVPLSTAALVTWLCAPIVGLVLFWFGLAWQRAIRNDPLRPRREAHARLTSLLTSMERTPINATPRAQLERDLLQWQHDTAVLFGVSHAAPSALEFEAVAGHVVASSRGEIDTLEWAKLWRETDRALYAAGSELPVDWLVRAESALTALPVPGFKPWRLFLPQNLLAFAAAVALLAAIVPPRVVAADANTATPAPSPEAAYRAGNFTAAEAAWRETIAHRPTDWIARHNLALALSQQDRSGEAAAQAAAAFVQRPDDPSVRWHFALASEKAGVVPGALQPFLSGGVVSSLAASHSPTGWQRLLILASFAAALGLGILLWNGYGARRRSGVWVGGAVLAAAFVVGAFSIFGVVTYGMAVDERAVVTFEPTTLHSIPTEADTTQKTTALPAGSLALASRTFIGGWVRLEFANGQTGWVRQEAVVPLWR